MLERYLDIIYQVSQIFVEALVEREERLDQQLPQLDSLIRPLIRETARTTVESTYLHFSKQSVEQAKRPGMTIHRNPEINLQTIYGPVALHSPYLYDRKKGCSLRPVQDQLHLVAEQKTLAVERALTDFGAERSFAKAATQFEEHYGWSIGASSVRSVTLEYAKKCEGFVEKKLNHAEDEYEQSLADRPGVDELLVELDGCNIPTVTLRPVLSMETSEKRKLPKRKRCCEWKEVRVGLVRRMEEVNKLYVARMDIYPEVTRKMFQLAVMKGLSSQTQIIGVGDGGIGLKEGLEESFPEMQFILDKPHLMEHFHEGAEALGLEGINKEKWVQKQEQKLSCGDVDEVLTELLGKACESGKKRIRNLYEYVDRFKDSVHYSEYKEKGWPIGSGEVESSHRYIPQERLKIAGAWWLPEHINPMLGLRVVRANDWWEEFWQKQEEQAWPVPGLGPNQ